MVPNKKWDFIVDFTSGVAGGTASVLVGQPLDTVKVKLQTFPSLYKNAFDCTYKTFKTDGLFRGLYAGTIPSLAAQISENAILFMAYGQCQKAVMLALGKNNVNDLNTLSNATAGGMAAFFSSLTLCPTELIKCKQQAMQEVMAVNKAKGITGNSIESGTWSLIKNIMREEGILGFFRGLVPTFVREIPGYFCFFGAYELTRTLLCKEDQNKDEIGPLKTIVSGAIGGMVFWIALFPADVIKSRAQVQKEKMSFMGTLINITRNEGLKALYKGLGPTLVRTAPATGALFLAVENTKKFLDQRIHFDDTIPDAGL